jgi:DNA repair ATPase RecN
MEAQLEQEDATNVKLKRLPELDFVLSFAHKRAREMLSEGDEDDTALTTAVATWLSELEDRFNTFEKQAAKFDEFENALLQSQRMHQKFRTDITALLKKEREINRALTETNILNERRKKAAKEQEAAERMLTAVAVDRAPTV